MLSDVSACTRGFDETGCAIVVAHKVSSPWAGMSGVESTMSEVLDMRESTADAVGETKRRILTFELELLMRKTASDAPGRLGDGMERRGMCTITAPVPLNDSAGWPPKRTRVVAPTRLSSA